MQGAIVSLVTMRRRPCSNDNSCNLLLSSTVVSCCQLSSTPTNQPVVCLPASSAADPWLGAARGAPANAARHIPDNNTPAPPEPRHGPQHELGARIDGRRVTDDKARSGMLQSQVPEAQSTVEVPHLSGFFTCRDSSPAYIPPLPEGMTWQAGTSEQQPRHQPRQALVTWNNKVRLRTGRTLCLLVPWILSYLVRQGRIPLPYGIYGTFSEVASNRLKTVALMPSWQSVRGRHWIAVPQVTSHFAD